MCEYVMMVSNNYKVINFWLPTTCFRLLHIFFVAGGAGPIMGDLWALKGITEEGTSFYFCKIRLNKRNPFLKSLSATVMCSIC